MVRVVVPLLALAAQQVPGTERSVAVLSETDYDRRTVPFVPGTERSVQNQCRYLQAGARTHCASPHNRCLTPSIAPFSSNWLVGPF
jgi:hypothetical protein